MMRNNKGISTFIATLLLMVLAVSAGVVIYAYTMGYLGGFGGTEQLGSMSVDESSATAGYYDSATSTYHPGNITVYVRNIGKTTIDLTNGEGAQVYIDGQMAHKWNVSDTDEATITIEEGDIQGVRITPYDPNIDSQSSDSPMLEAGKTYEIKMIAADNTQVSFNVKAK